jgi:hypothetical protein
MLHVFYLYICVILPLLGGAGRRSGLRRRPPRARGVTCAFSKEHLLAGASGPSALRAAELRSGRTVVRRVEAQRPVSPGEFGHLFQHLVSV